MEEVTKERGKKRKKMRRVEMTIRTKVILILQVATKSRSAHQVRRHENGIIGMKYNNNFFYFRRRLVEFGYVLLWQTLCRSTND